MVEIHKIQFDGENIIAHASDGTKYKAHFTLTPIGRTNGPGEPNISNSGDVAGRFEKGYDITLYELEIKRHGRHEQTDTIELGTNDLAEVLEELKFQNFVYYESPIVDKEKYKGYEDFRKQCIDISEDKIGIRAVPEGKIRYTAYFI